MSDDVVKAVATLVNGHWERTGKVILLSNLPALLSKTLDVRTALRNKKLSARLREADAAEVIRLVQSPRSALMWGVIPAQADVPDLDSVFPIPARPASAGEGSAKVSPVVKIAFTRPLAEGMDRYLLLDGHTRFQDVLAGDPLPEGSKQIPRASLRTPDAEDDDVLGAVSAWAQENNVDASKYLQQVAAPAMPKVPTRTRSAALANFLAELTNEERRRLMLPADIVAKFV